MHGMIIRLALRVLSAGLRGLVPPRRYSMAEQAQKLYQRIQNEPDDLRKNMSLMNLYDRNEHLFFFVLSRHDVRNALARHQPDHQC
jgi:hypothetical protein